MIFPSELIKRLFTVFSLLLLIALTGNGQDFMTQWTFPYATTSIQFSTLTTDSVGYTWTAYPSGNGGNGRFSMTTSGQVTLNGMDIEAGDTVVLKMEPQQLNRFFINISANRENLTDVLQWGSVSWTSMENAFANCKFLNISANDHPDLSKVKNMSAMFLDAESFDQNINDWDVSSVTNMSIMFSGAESFNGNISDWDVSNVTNMRSMFSGAFSFNQDIGKWNVSNVVDMSGMFYSAYVFNQNINEWNTSKVEDMRSMFNGAKSFNQDISSWDVSNVNRMREMFRDAFSFNGNIGNWDVSNVTNMYSMFENASSFDQNINEWDVSNVEYMSKMFKDAYSFDQPLNKWNVSSVTKMDELFNEASSFNQDIGDWDVSNVTSMAFMFYDAIYFDHDIGSWDVSSVVNMSYMFEGSSLNQPLHNWDVSSVMDMTGMFLYTDFNQNLGDWKLNPYVRMDKMLAASGMDCNHYSTSLVGWQKNNPNVYDITLGAVDIRYGTNAVDARDTLVNYQGWNIQGDEAVNSECNALVNSEFVYFNNQNKLTIYPNPASNFIHIKGNQFQNEDIGVINSIGQDVTTQIIIQNRYSSSTTLNLTKLNAGIYLLKSKSGSGMIFKK